jgi:acyl-CoA synthetase (AMP-forming)/AMP-acid ligase II
MFISGGSNVYPREIEEAIQTFPGVAQTCVVGVPDPDWGEVGIAVVEMDTPTGQYDRTRLGAELKAFLKERLAGYKVPKEYVLVDALPVTAYGKIARRELRAELSEGRGRAR